MAALNRRRGVEMASVSFIESPTLSAFYSVFATLLSVGPGHPSQATSWLFRLYNPPGIGCVCLVNGMA